MLGSPGQVQLLQGARDELACYKDEANPRLRTRLFTGHAVIHIIIRALAKITTSIHLYEFLLYTIQLQTTEPP